MDPDAAYVDRIVRRGESLDRKSAHIRKSVVQAGRDLSRSKDELHAELAALATEVAALQEEMGRTVERARQAAERFRTILKRGDLSRLQARIDAWGPEKRISRDAFLRML